MRDPPPWPKHLPLLHWHLKINIGFGGDKPHPNRIKESRLFWYYDCQTFIAFFHLPLPHSTSPPFLADFCQAHLFILHFYSSFFFFLRKVKLFTKSSFNSLPFSAIFLWSGCLCTSFPCALELMIHGVKISLLHRTSGWYSTYFYSFFPNLPGFYPSEG